MINRMWAVPENRMSQNPEQDALDALPVASEDPPKKRSLQLVWIIPLVAALIGGWLAVKSVLERGPVITITLLSAEGLEAGKTKIKYKDVDIGVVSHVALSPDRKHVVATADMARDTDSMLLKDTRFWVVKPRIGVGGVSGLGTLLSGAYIGMDIGKSTEERRNFAGLDVPPVVTGELPGRQFTLYTTDIGSLGVGSPVYFRRIQVGQVTAFQLDADGRSVTLRVFINSPYEKYVTSSSRFWQASGLDVSIDANGVKLQTESLAAILAGGIAFQDASDLPAGQPAKENTSFRLAADKVQAMKTPDTDTRTFLMYFTESLRGLSVGAPLDFRGIVIGEVKSIDLEYDPKGRKLLFPVEVAIYPHRLQARYRRPQDQKLADYSEEHQRKLLDAMVEHGFRGQLRTGNLLTGQLYIALDFFPTLPKTTIDWRQEPHVLPTTPGSFGELQNSAASILKKIDKIPFDEISRELRVAIRDLNRAINSSDKLIRRLDGEVAPEAAATLAQARRTLDTAQGTLAQDAPLQQDLRGTLREVGRAAESLRNLTDYLERNPEALLRGKAKDQ